MRKGGAWPYAAAALSLIVLLGGCSSDTVRYTSNYPANLYIKVKQLKTDRVSLANSFEATLHVGSMDKDCKSTYLGSVELEKGKETEIGLPPGRTSALVVEFANDSSLSAGVSSATAYRTLFTPRPGHRYEMEVSYDSGAYDVNIYEYDHSSRARRLVEPKPFSACAK